MPPLPHVLGLVGLLVGLALFAHWFTYVLGSPLATPDRVDPSAILFFVPYLLAKRRLRGKLFEWAVDAWRQQLNANSDRIGATQALLDHRHNVVVQGRVLFRWERALLCPVCLHFWLTVLAGVGWCALHGPLRADLAIGALTYLFLHLLIRKL